ncbi:MAG: thiamine pyrophosphate-dependent dehydrogenase E1 component subunit alpha [Rhodospirillales bacterium]|nr:thiamine pyrophosphate-dependent dehydrogenase E1 component subunit alpha [Rhodospirillales bacterium]
MSDNIRTEIRIKLFKELVCVRKTEQTLAERYKQQEMRTPTHFGIGQEAVAVGVCSALNRDDVVYSHHRSHNHYLAKGGSVYGLAAELFGRETGCSKGRGGSVHLTCREEGFIASSAILGETAAAAVGSALSISMDGAKQIAGAFFGDAVLEEGIFYESVNYASINNLPALLVCENNGFATESPLSVRQPSGIDFCKRVEAFGATALSIDGNDVEAVYNAAQKAISHIRSGKGPFFLHCITYRWCEHVGPFFDHEMDRTYRTKEDVEAWMEKCPIKRSRAKLIIDEIASSDQLDEWEAEIQSSIDDDISRAYSDPWPNPADIFENVC